MPRWLNIAFDWFGAKVLHQVNVDIDLRMREAGEKIVSIARGLAPVKTGALRDSIDYLVVYNESGSRHELLIQVGESYGIFQEVGTRNIPPHPYIRPALNEVRAFGFDIGMDFQSSELPWPGLLARTGPGGAGFEKPISHPGWKPLTAKQQHHLEHVLTPSIRRLNRGNVKRATMRVRVI